ncbi:MAG: hypothetical protein ACRDHW_01655 [Ktedonobacteraceae bacterium]
MKSYTIRECCELLQCDAKTFHRWLRKGNINLEEQKGISDERTRYLTEDQIRALAWAHGRSWPPEPHNPNVPRSLNLSIGKYHNLVDRVDYHDAQFSEQDVRMDDQDKEITEWSGRIKAMELGMAELRQTVADLQAQMKQQG